MKTIKISALILTLLLGMFPGAHIEAQDCSAYTEQNEGNLVGYIVASNLPSENNNNRIYMSSSDDPWSGGVTYGVTYDRDTRVFSGLAWNEQIGWIDFDFGGSDEADALAPNGGFEWGGWEGTIIGLDNVTYSTNDGRFLSSDPGAYDAQYPSGGEEGDVPVGMGSLDFNEVGFDNTLVPPECDEYVDVLANGATSTNLSSCGGTVGLVWNSNNIVPNSCETVDNGAPWNSPGSRADSNTSGESSGAITSGNTPAYFRIQCEGLVTGNTVTGTAIVTCGDDPDPGSGTGTTSGFQFIES